MQKTSRPFRLFCVGLSVLLVLSFAGCTPQNSSPISAASLSQDISTPVTGTAIQSTLTFGNNQTIGFYYNSDDAFNPTTLGFAKHSSQIQEQDNIIYYILRSQNTYSLWAQDLETEGTKLIYQTDERVLSNFIVLSPTQYILCFDTHDVIENVFSYPYYLYLYDSSAQTLEDINEKYSLSPQPAYFAIFSEGNLYISQSPTAENPDRHVYWVNPSGQSHLMPDSVPLTFSVDNGRLFFEENSTIYCVTTPSESPVPILELSGFDFTINGDKLFLSSADSPNEGFIINLNKKSLVNSLAASNDDSSSKIDYSFAPSKNYIALETKTLSNEDGPFVSYSQIQLSCYTWDGDETVHFNPFDQPPLVSDMQYVVVHDTVYYLLENDTTHTTSLQSMRAV